MNLVFANPAGLWALVAVPAIVAIHCLRPAARPRRVSTLFLLENLDPGASRARRLRRLRFSAALWCQLAAALLLAWVLAEPRWVRAGTRQTVAVVLDASASLRPFRARAAGVLRPVLDQWSRAADRTAWIVRESDPRRRPLYEGESLDAVMASLERWRPNVGSHDLASAVREFQLSVGPGVSMVVLTDHRVELSPGVAVLGVGEPIANAGFAGVSIEEAVAGLKWRALVRHCGPVAEKRHLHVFDSSGRELGAPQVLELGPDALLAIEGVFPAEVDALQLALDADAFDLDDRLPLVRPRAKPLRWAAGPEVPPLLARFAKSLPGAQQDADAPDLRLLAVGGDAAPATPGAAVLVWRPAEASASSKVLRAPVLAEKHPLVDGLIWEGFLAGGAGPLQPPAAATVLLWQENRELVWLEGGEDSRRLVLNFDAARSNADRLPAFVVLLHRFADTVRGALRQRWAENLETQQRFDLGTGWARGRDVLDVEVVGGSKTATAAGVLRAPDEPGFFAVRCGGEEAFHGAAHFGDVREGDFRGAETFAVEGRSVAEALRAASQPDRWRPLWILLAGGCLAGAWWSVRKRGGER
ncbi:MAG TPA: BatA domain-containing protein [Opitutaceae bacterium]|nr:BatA domain-containing protein [Opitutaceae bacterium]